MISKKKIVIKLSNKNYLYIKYFNKNKLNKSFLNNYVSSLKKNKFIVYKTKNYLDQIRYLKNINRSKDKIIFLLEFNKMFIGTIGVQKIKKNFFIGILIFSKKIRNKGYSKYFLYGVIKFLKYFYKINNYLAGINSDNLRSINLFKSLGFRVKSRFVKSFLFYLNYKKIKKPNCIDEYSII
jgi:RimJ/RimL family protein N-acetyltransferase